MSRILLEVCVDDAAGLAAAVAGGADRIELCAALGLGGLTPSAGLMAIVAECPLPVMAMIRPRAGDFVFSADERRIMRSDIAAARAAGVAGIVIGASLPDGRLDAATLEDLIYVAEGLDVTLHRAIDLVPNVAEAMVLCVRLGISRVLSSGGATSALAGLDQLAAMREAAPTITIMPGGGINAKSIAALATRLRLTEVHASCSSPLPDPSHAAITAFGFQRLDARATDLHSVRELRAALDQIAASRPSGWTAS